MKTNKKVLIVLGICLILVGTVVIYSLPLLEELIHIRFSLFNICVGTGCKAGGGGCSVLPCPQPAWCEGYRYGLICLSDVEKYCRYAHSSESIEKCRCEALKETEGYDGKYRKFCEKNKICYTNPWEYEFGCAEDMDGVCRKAEEVFKSPNACSDWEGSALSYGLVKDGSECSKSWIDIYMHGDETQKRNIFYKEFKNFCILICENCKSYLCNEGNICEYSLHPPNTTTTE